MQAYRSRSVFDGEAFIAGGGTVLVADGSIKGVEPYGFPVPDGWSVVDLDGTMLPGLIDTHTHLVGSGVPNALDFVGGYSSAEMDAVVTESLRAELAAGVTTVRDLGDRDYHVADRRSRPGEPTVIAAGPPLTTAGGHCAYMGGAVDGPQEIRAAIAAHVERGVDVIKVMASGGMTTLGTDVLSPQFSLQDLLLMVELAHAAGLPITAHAHAKSAIALAVAAGVDGVEHCTCLTENGPQPDAELFDAIAAAGIVVCTTQGGDFLKLPEPPPTIKAVLERIGMTPRQLVARRRTILAGLHQAGVTLTCGVDSGIGPVKPHGMVAAAVADHVTAGVPIETALAGATAIAARACGVQGSKGRIRPGHDADLLSVAGDVASEITALERVTAVLLGGELVAGGSHRPD